MSELVLIYIAGAGRSGSTILDEILGEGRGCFSLGEMRQIWKIIRKQALCSCGRIYRDCPFWSEVLRRVFGKDAPSSGELEEILRAQRVVENIPLLSEGRRKRYLASHRKRLTFYRNLLQAILREVREVSGAKVLIDSTKLPHYLYLLRELEDIRIFLLHLVRDSRAVAFSWLRRKYHPAIRDYMKRHHPYTSTRLWVRFNWGVHRLQEVFSFPYYRLRYEDFVRAPNRELAKIEETFNLQGVFPRIEGCLKLGEKHLLGGNPAGFVSREISLRPDTQWLKEMRLRDRILVTLMSWPLLRRYGYPLFPTFGGKD